MTTASDRAALSDARRQARDLLNEFDVADGLASYYALHHPDHRTALLVHHDVGGEVDGFLARCQTGFDLFRPLVTMRVRGGNSPESALLRDALVPGRPYLLVVPAALVPRLDPHLRLTDAQEARVMRLDPARFRPEMNAMVVRKPDADGSPRAEVRRGEQVVAAAGVNWRSPMFAEIYVRVQPEARGRGWGRSVVRAVTAELLKGSVTPLYYVSQDNSASYDLALDVGFVDTGAREVTAEATLAAG
jgi:GNAT superfamily N-acetyltransferase